MRRIVGMEWVRVSWSLGWLGGLGQPKATSPKRRLAHPTPVNNGKDGLLWLLAVRVMGR